MDLLTEAIHYIAVNPARFQNALAQHLEISGWAISMAALIAIPGGYLCARPAFPPFGVMTFFGVLRVVPGLAILALLLPVLGSGRPLAVVGLILLALPTILLNTLSGFRQVDSSQMEAARGLGMGEWNQLTRVALPLAMPAIWNGLRIASVEVISGATLAAFVGGGGLGAFIINGLSLYYFPLMLVGAVPIALLAILVELLFSALTAQSRKFQTC